ncbi:Polysaccharide deacetylase [Rathayibacter oskolensis]|uniref:Polysaccharide deacetylase n=1 Tax=Rathayibacter oskolensis TaxID=1891671 RepID=A0A1X7PDY5_9MICO|nr:Polysaccharide deacetylase [Rathayibacter oskolensis]
MRRAATAAVIALLLAGCAAEPIDVPAGTVAAVQATQTSTPAPSRPPTVTPTPTPSATPSATLTPSAVPTVATAVWPDNAQVSHLFFHSLVVDPARAFASPEDGAGYLDYMVTKDEFAALLEQVYANGYVLVSPHDLYERAVDGTVTPQPLALPVGKKPLVISQDDVDYYEYMEGDGFADALVLDRNGDVRTRYTDASGRTRVGADDLVPIVDDFVAAHPDFSFQGAKGVIALTGYNGVLGYRTSRLAYGDTNPRIEQDTADATAVAAAMTADGWEFASHSWGHIDMRESSMERITADVGKWRDEVQPIVGATDLFVYPFGADIAGVGGYSGATYDLLAAEGFTAFFTVDASRPAWGQWGPGYLREARINVDGISLRAAIEGRNDTLYSFFDPASVLDPARPPSISGE